MSPAGGPAGARTAGDLLAALSRPSAWRPPPGRVEVLETHISLLFFVGEHVYKVKKPVRFAFLDFSTLARRRALCEEEVRLNRRLAPDTYLGVVPIVVHGDGLLVEGEGEPLEWAVKMRRLPSERMLDRLLAQGALDNERLGALAEVLVAFHEEAATGEGVDEHGSWTAVRRVVLGNLDELSVAVGDVEAPDGRAVLGEATHAFLRENAARFLASHRRLLEARVRRGRIRDGHGDLHAGNVCFADEGPVLYDALEFSAALRCGDVAADLAFLAMDLDHRGYRAHARWLVEEYARRAGDTAVPWLIGFYKAHRALVRAKVAFLRAAEAGRAPEEAAGDRRAALGYGVLAASEALPASLLLTCGLPGSGKSTTARRLGSALDALVLRSDVLRKRLAGVPPTARGGEAWGQGLYDGAHTERTYRELQRQALDALRRGRSVIVDAAFGRAALRRQFVDVATRLGFPAAVVHSSCPDEVVRQRLAARARDPREVSDAGVDVYERARSAWEPPDELPETHLVPAPSGLPDELVAAAAVERLLQQHAGLSGASDPPGGFR